MKLKTKTVERTEVKLRLTAREMAVLNWLVDYATDDLCESWNNAVRCFEADKSNISETEFASTAMDIFVAMGETWDKVSADLNYPEG